MTKSEEKTLLEQIEGLILSAGNDSYIHDTFAGVVEICRRNIENDFGDYPVKDLEIERAKHEKDNREHGALLQKLEHENSALVSNLEKKDEQVKMAEHLLNAKDAEIEQLQDQIDEMRRNANGANALLADKDSEIIRLKAEIYDLMKGEKNNG